MLCERCNKKKVAVLFRENLNGRIRSLQLCHDCADSLGNTEELETVGLEVAGFLSPFGQADEMNLPLSVYYPHAQSPHPSADSSDKCRGCGITWEEIVKAGKVGCSACYTIFADALSEAVHSAHGTVEHRGRCTAGHRTRALKMERLATLKKRLKEAVAAEKYENAVELRDQIRSLEADL